MARARGVRQPGATPSSGSAGSTMLELVLDEAEALRPGERGRRTGRADGPRSRPAILDEAASGCESRERTATGRPLAAIYYHYAALAGRAGALERRKHLVEEGLEAHPHVGAAPSARGRRSPSGAATRAPPSSTTGRPSRRSLARAGPQESGRPRLSAERLRRGARALRACVAAPRPTRRRPLHQARQHVLQDGRTGSRRSNAGAARWN